MKDLLLLGNFVSLHPISVFRNGQLFEDERRKSFPKWRTSSQMASVNINKQYNGN